MSAFSKFHLEKAALFFLIGCFLCLFLIIDAEKHHFESDFNEHTNFLDQTKINSKYYYSIPQQTSLIPGDLIYYKNSENEDYQYFEINEIHYKRGSNLFITAKGNNLEGTLRKDLVLNKDWKSSREPVVLKTSNGNENILISDIDLIVGESSVLPSEDIKSISKSNKIWSTYQRTYSESSLHTIKERPKWTHKKADSNSSDYDLFTPPIIYIHEGKLTTRIPSKEEAKEDIEPFGLELISALKTPYPLLLVGWVGDVPYFQLKEDSLNMSGGKITRNRIVPQTRYKKAINPSPGQSKLIACDANDTEAWFVVENFEVLQYKNSKTGGVKPVGIATVKDFISNRPPFKINSLNTDAPAGDYQFKFSVKFPGISEEQLLFSSADTGKIFTFSGRDFEISQVDLDLNKVMITKKDPRVAENTSRTFAF